MPKCAKPLLLAAFGSQRLNTPAQGAFRAGAPSEAAHNSASLRSNKGLSSRTNSIASSSELVAMMLRQSRLICSSKFIVARYKLATSLQKVHKSALHGNPDSSISAWLRSN
jgi:hypothetical protein